MFVESELTWTIAVKPSDLKSGLHIQRALLRKLLADFDKLKCSEKHGYYICVTTLEGIGEGKIWEGKGCVAYRVRFRCLTYKPQKSEKVLAVVTGEFQEKGVMCSFGPMDNTMFLSSKPMKDQYTFVAASETKPAHFKGKDGSIIEPGTVLRVKIIGVKFDTLTRSFGTVCSVSGHYLGIDRRIWADPQAAAGGDADWGRKLGADLGNEGGGWDCDAHAENGEQGWGSSPPKKSGDKAAKSNDGWEDAPAEKADDEGGWDSSPDAKAGKGKGYDWDDDPAEKADDGGDWDSLPDDKAGKAKAKGYDWDDVPAEKADNGGGFDSSPDDKAGKGKGWDAATENTGGWDSAPTKETNSGGWGAAPAEKSTNDGGRGKACPGGKRGGLKNTALGEKPKITGDWETTTDPGKEDTGSWGSPPTKKSKVGGRNSTPSEKESTDFGAWGDPAPKTNSGAWETVEAENTGKGWGD